MTVVTERACQQCGGPMTGRADKRFCTDACRTAHGRASRTEPNRTAVTVAPLAEVIALPRADAAPCWDPPAIPLGPWQPEPAEPCPDCGQPLIAEPCGTWRACLACRQAVPPAAISRPYQRGPATRKVVSRRELDAARRDLAEAKAVMAGQLRRMIPRLDDGSAGRVQSYLADVLDADSMARLGELADELRAETLRPAAPIATAAALPAAEEDQDDDDGETYIRLEDGTVVLAAWTDDGRLVPASSIREAEPASLRAVPAPLALAAAPSPPSWADGLSALGWRLHTSPGGCQIIDSLGEFCGDSENPYQVTDRYGRPAWICWKHKEPLTLMLQRLRRSA